MAGAQLERGDAQLGLGSLAHHGEVDAPAAREHGSGDVGVPVELGGLGVERLEPGRTNVVADLFEIVPAMIEALKSS